MKLLKTPVSISSTVRVSLMIDGEFPSRVCVTCVCVCVFFFVAFFVVFFYNFRCPVFDVSIRVHPRFLLTELGIRGGGGVNWLIFCKCQVLTRYVMKRLFSRAFDIEGHTPPRRH